MCAATGSFWLSCGSASCSAEIENYEFQLARKVVDRIFTWIHANDVAVDSSAFEGLETVVSRRIKYGQRNGIVGWQWQPE